MNIKNSKQNRTWVLGLSAVVLASGSCVRAQEAPDSTETDTTTSSTTTTDTAASGSTSGSTRMGRSVGAGRSSNMSGMNMRSMNAAMLIATLSEEKTEIAALSAQQAKFRQMGGRENLQIARMWGRWIAEHKAGGPTFMRLIKQNGGDPNEAHVLKPAVLGTRQQMLDATHKDHQAAVMSSQMRYGMTNSRAIKRAMHMRGNLARKHLRQMAPYHAMHNMMKMDKMSVQG